MAYLLIEAAPSHKGVLVLKHLEIPFWEGMPPDLVAAVRERYVVGIYFGFAVRVSRDVEGVDFYMAAENVMLGYRGVTPRVPLNGFHFIEDRFESRGERVIEFDYVFIGNAQRRKNLLELVRAISCMSESPSICIVTKVASSIESRLYSRRVRSSLNAMTDGTRKRIRYIEIPSHSDGIPAFLMSSLLRNSRALICISRAEGAARVVAEAVLNSLPIVYYSKMVGGTCNHLDDKIDFRVDDIDQLPQVLDDAYRTLKARGCSERNDGAVYLEKNSKKVLAKFLEKHFSHVLTKTVIEEVFDKRLYNAFSGHQNHFPESVSNRATDEVLSYSKMYKFLRLVDGQSGPVPIAMKFRDLKVLAGKPWGGFRGLVKAIIS